MSSSVPRRVHLNAAGAVVGGATRHLAPFLHALVAARPDWELTLWATAGADLGRLPEGVERRSMTATSYRGRLWWESVTLPRALQAEQADVLVNLTNSGPLRCPVPSLLYERNVLWFDRTCAHLMDRRGRAEAALRRALAYGQARGATMVVVPSQAAAEILRSWPLWPADVPVEVVPHGVDAERFAFAPHPWPPPTDRPLRLLCVSQPYPHKDQALLIRLVRRLIDDGREATLWLTVGPDSRFPTAAELERLAGRLDVADAVAFLGATDDVERLYREADVVVSPSLTESFGFPLIEAMATGVPVVASSIAASVELLGADGWYFPPGDVTGAGAAVEELLATPGDEVSARLDAARATVGALSWAANADRIARLVESVVA